MESQPQPEATESHEAREPNTIYIGRKPTNR